MLYRRAVGLDIEGITDAGDHYACTCVGRMYYHGFGMCSNESAAINGYRKAAEQGYADAQFSLEEMYNIRCGVDVK